MCDGLGYATNTKALIITLAIQELREVLPKLGGHAETAITLAGIGDIFVSGVSAHGRNRTFGERLVSAKRVTLFLSALEQSRGSRRLKRCATFFQKKIRAPLIKTVAQCLSATSDFERPLIKFIERLAL